MMTRRIRNRIAYLALTSAAAAPLCVLRAQRLPAGLMADRRPFFAAAVTLAARDWSVKALSMIRHEFTASPSGFNRHPRKRPNWNGSWKTSGTPTHLGITYG
jgi:hypothetical protein